MSRSILLLTLVLTASACGRTPDGGDADEFADAALGAPIRADSARGAFEACVTPVTALIPLNEPFAVLLSLTDPATGEPYADYDAVTIDARMPAHQHGMLRDVGLVPQEDGTLLAEGMLFHMVGHWEIHVDVRRGAHIERAQLDVQLEF